MILDNDKEIKDYITYRIIYKENLGSNTAQRRASTMISWFK